MIHVIATIELHPGQRENFLAEFRKLIPHVHAEEGCLEYGPTVDEATDIGAQEGPRADVVTVVEKWESVEHLKAHLVAPHMEAYRPAVKDMVIKTVLQILKPA
ncbi:putative quinol monooxygenase [Singulisphaera sp. PoT]|uniref:putative quinol monooxygenase n=1 Tax=Singulisphaera sp. PoT TaxID=3411797 RepID=UPI003BF4BBC1